MLPAINRLKKEKDFEYLFKKGKGFKEDFLYLKIIGNNLKNSRFGFVVSNKFSKKAVVRNKIKRRLRALVQEKMPSVKQGIDAAIIVIPGFKADNYLELEKKVNKLFEKAGILNNLK